MLIGNFGLCVRSLWYNLTYHLDPTMNLLLGLCCDNPERATQGFYHEYLPALWQETFGTSQRLVPRSGMKVGGK